MANVPAADQPGQPVIRIVPDTGFYIAAILKNGYARSYLVGRGSKFLAYQLYTSEAILLELQAKLEDRFGFDRAQVVSALHTIHKVVHVMAPRQKVLVVRDPDDNKILECALEAQATMIVSLDKDLLDLKEYRGITMVHPRMLQYMFPDSPS